MRLLCIDHFFEQDIGALKAAAGSRRCWSVSYGHFWRLAQRFFPEEVFTGIETFFRPEHESQRTRYAQAAGLELERLHRLYRFDAVLAPSDTFFWIRAVIEACQRLGIPFVVLQKEATIPPGWLEGPAREWGAISPFIADHMLVSSEHHRQFWINAGVASDSVTVTGQPRFDIYARPDRRRSWNALGIEVPNKPTVLFLTYDSNAYLPIIDRSGLHPWLELRSDTESVLLEIARRGEATILVKSHPQPAEDQTAHLAALAQHPGVSVLPARGDVRDYILNADVVVGFQTTALLEALTAGRPTIYTWWTDPVKQHEDELIPFHRESEALAVADSPAELRRLLEHHLQRGEPPSGDSREMVTRYLGPIDGHAAERCWLQLEGIRAATQLTPAGRRLRSRGRSLRLPTAFSSAAAAGAWSVATALAPLSYSAYRFLSRVASRPAPIGAEAFHRELQLRRQSAIDRLVAASTR
jgi:hypothetical protein